jgi:hypothetical protein
MPTSFSVQLAGNGLIKSRLIQVITKFTLYVNSFIFQILTIEHYAIKHCAIHHYAIHHYAYNSNC